MLIMPSPKGSAMRHEKQSISMYLRCLMEQKRMYFIMETGSVNLAWPSAAVMTDCAR